MNLYLGIDFGTSGVRAIVIDSDFTIKSEFQYNFNDDITNLSNIWQTALFHVLNQINSDLKIHIKAICINGTSSTVLLCDRFGNPITSPLMYNDLHGVDVMDKIRAIAPPKHTVLSPTSSLAKLFFWLTQFTPPRLWESGLGGEGYFLHQADWLGFLLHGKIGITDYHNALKLGYDVENLCYPEWLTNLPFFSILPKVIKPGEIIREILPDIAEKLGFKKDCVICAGTTDSMAAFIASGANLPGESVTSLGSTLVIKLLSKTRIENADYGIYSHKLGDLWLIGGASNTGGCVLRKYFTDEELVKFSQQINPEIATGLDYYPLIKPGERFPINDANLPPKLLPYPENKVKFLQGILESIGKIEAKGYELLEELGGSKLTKVYTAGGGSKNQNWAKIREKYLKVPILRSKYPEAAYGSALLSLDNFS